MTDSTGALETLVQAAETKAREDGNEEESRFPSSMFEELERDRPRPLDQVIVHKVPKGYNYPFGTVEFHLDGFEKTLASIMKRVVKPTTKSYDFFPFVNGYLKNPPHQLRFI